MKKSFLTLILSSISFLSFSQNLAEKAHLPISLAQKMTLNLIKNYNLTPTQTEEVLKIQESKYEALAKLESMKAKDMKKYIAKRLSTFETADNHLMTLLDVQQLSIFKLEQIEKANKYEKIVYGLKKQGISQADIEKKLAETEF